MSLTEQELLIIETKYLAKDSLKECFYQMLLKWRLKEPENCYLEHLCKKLQMNVNKFNNFKRTFDEDELTKNRFDCYFNQYFENFENIQEIFYKLKNVRI